jgi:hypothetical protein
MKRWICSVAVVVTAAALIVAGATVAMGARSQDWQFEGRSIFQDDFIPKTFRTQIGEVPNLGWYISGARFVAIERHPSLRLWAADGNPDVATLIGDLTDQERLALRARERVGCDLNASDRLSVYRVDRQGKGMALHTTKPFTGTWRRGLSTRTLTPESLTGALLALQWTGPADMRRYDSASAGPQGFFYSFHERYDLTSRQLQQYALVLHDASGHVVAFDNQQMTAEKVPDATDWPTWEERRRPLGYVRAVFELPGFPYPVLFEEGDSQEGRSLTLTTFTPERKRVSYNFYEYTFNCGPGAGRQTH